MKYLANEDIAQKNKTIIFNGRQANDRLVSKDNTLVSLEFNISINCLRGDA